MKIFIVPFFLLSLSLFGQNNLSISGKVVDKGNNSELPFATIAFFDTQNKLISGTTTDEKGTFELSVKSMDTVLIKVQYIGFNPFDTLVSSNIKNTNHNFVFSLSPLSSQLTEITVNAERMTTSAQMDRQSFNASKLGNTVSGTGLDVLQRLPSVTINSEGKILMRGNAEFLVTINGKFTNQTAADVLAQLPANTIESIEIMSSPSASLDAEGKAGIINIITKKNISEGWGIVFNGNLSNINPDRYGSDLTFYHSNSKFNSFITANYRQYKIGGYRKGEIRTLFQDTITYSASGGERPTEEKIYGIRAGTNYSINKSSNINAGFYYGYKQNDRIANLHYRQYSNSQLPLNLYQSFSDDQLESLFYNQNLFSRTGQFFTTNTDYSKTFINKNKLSLAAIYEYSVLGGPLTNQNTDDTNGELLLKERADEISPLDAWRLQADYSIFLNENMTLETGYQWRTVHHLGDFSFERLNLATNNWEEDPEFNDELDLRQTVHAGYVQLSGQFQQIKYRAGLRGEQMYRNLSHTLGSTPIKLSQFNFFPSLQAFWELKNDQELKLGYSKRIDRPTTKALSPFKNHRHSEAIWIGDPNLLPEISNNVELGYIKKYEKGSISLTAYHNRTTNLIFRTNASYSRITLFTISTNAGNSNSTGLEFISDWQIAKWFRFYISGNSYYFNISNIENAEGNSTNSINYNLNGNISFRLHPKFRVQWDATYLSKTVTAQGFDTDFLLSNIGLKYTVNKKITVDLLFQNIFNTNVQTITTKTDVFYSSTEYSKFDRIIQLSLSYRFNDSGKNTKTLKTEYGEKDF
jgi:outer membrane receptor protein involved in Fe transport